jgi:hypothetical protein
MLYILSVESDGKCFTSCMSPTSQDAVCFFLKRVEH